MADIVEPSRLFSVEPVCTEPARRESLVSYLIRLARAHRLSPRQLIRTEFLPVAGLGAGPICACFYADQAKTINGVGKYARTFLGVANDLTHQTGLMQLTMLPWADVIPQVGLGLLADEVRWCPQCLIEQRQRTEQSYFPLLWSLHCYQVCNKHSRALETRCPWCGRAQHVIPDYPDQARCSHCRGFLGSKGRNCGPAPSATTVTPRQLYWASLLAGMLSDNANVESWATHSNLCKRLMALANRWTSGEKRQLSLQLGLTKTSVSCWVAKGQRPAFPQLLHLCEATGLSLSGLLKDLNGPQPSIVHTPPAISVEARRPGRAEEDSRIESEVRDILDNPNDCRSIARVAKAVGLTLSQFRYRHAAAAAMISSRHRLYVLEQTRLRNLAREAVVQDVIKTLLAQGLWPSCRRVTKQIHLHRISLQRPEIRRVYRLARAHCLPELRKAVQQR